MGWNFRKYLVLGFLLLAIFVIAFLILFKLFYKQSTCFDGLKNQNESGVDCGGKCLKICEEDVSSIEVRWARAFKVKEGRYSVLAFAENNNLFVGKADYIFGIYDEENILIRNFEGTAFIPSRRPFAVFMGNIDVGFRKPGRVIFQFKEINWQKNTSGLDSISVKEVAREKDEKGAPRISVQLSNDDRNSVNDLVSVAVLYDSLGDAIGALRIPVGNIPPFESKKVYFSWPLPLSSPIDKIDILKWVEPKF